MAVLWWITIFLTVWFGFSAAALGWGSADPMMVVSCLGAALGAVLLTLYLRGERDLVRIIGRGAMVLLPVILVALIPMLLVLESTSMDVRLRQGILAGLIIASGWLATFLFQEERSRRDRADQRKDTLRVLRNEIFTILEKLDRMDIEKSGKAMRTKIYSVYRFHPFSASESPPSLLNAVSGSLTALQGDVLYPVTRFYASYSDLSAMVEDFRSEEVKALQISRRVSLHHSLTSFRVATFFWGVRALITIQDALGSPDPEEVNLSDRNKSIKDAALDAHRTRKSEEWSSQ